ncbi:MAG TPA: hypothetical protein DD624_05780, partial [Alphaproteobacteria bacterium]|nr:hypothetical protein [Alphaproteobacteria bacterium]
GLDLTTANQIKASLTDLEILRQKRLAGQRAEEQAVAEMARITEEQRAKDEQPPAVEQSRPVEQPRFTEQPLPAKQEQADFAEPDAQESSSTLSKELELLRARRLNQASPEEMKARLQDVVLEKRPKLKSG